ncbi:hypothetical protein EJB05_20740 [Eragrostis curvula]|uniref:E3 ubiquitin-protein ligase PRT1 n=1 Tax=Eragrostis curvula TaxID=38414 RepID=A0A5J9UZK5_9POAL|nr:hypothetical protein EJB05_20740 [Eragrostis curvula]
MASDGCQPEPEKAEAAAASASSGPACDCLEDPRLQCCVCLDILYKPVVIGCGHMSCFWCVHKAMNVLRESHCPVCRQPYKHFPSICQLLHHLLLKLEPADYKRREKEILEEEKHMEAYSPQLIEFYNSKNNEIGKDGENGLEDGKIGPPQEVSCNGNVVNDQSKIIKLVDVSCPLCKEMLYQPAVLNCGHVYCVSCLSSLNEEPLKCQVCGGLHPGDVPNVCLDLDHFLEEYFPAEYVSRGEKVQFEKRKCNREASSSGTSSTKKGSVAQLDEDLSNVHVGVGCDSCGVYPIRGKRYKCQDCTELIGFDLCEECYTSSSNLPGRFNQQHTPDHRMEVDDTTLVHRLMMLQDVVVAPGVMMQFVAEVEEMEDADDEEALAPGAMVQDVIDNQEMEGNGEEDQVL